MGLENIGGWELIALILLGLFIFGPDKLPKAISDGVRMVRQLRDMARNATSDLSRELGTDIQLEDLHPRTFVRKHLLSEEDEAALRRPLEQAYRDLRDTTTALDPRAADAPEPTAVQAKANGHRAHTYDADAT
jgi:sec-independent protein translocase protein TatB